MAKKLLKYFHQGLQHYYNQDWDIAINLFNKSDKFEDKFEGRKTNPSLVFIERVKMFIKDPPSKDWDGVYALHSK